VITSSVDVGRDLAFFVLVVAGGVVLRFLGQASLRLIEGERDLPHREELAWGATWLWLVIPSLVAACGLLLHLDHRLGYYELTTVLTVRLLCPVVLVLVYRYRRHALIGLFVWCATLRQRNRPDFQLAQWLQKQDARVRRHRWTKLVVESGVALLAGTTVYLVWRYTLPLDRIMMQARENSALEQVLQREMTGAAIERVYIYAPDPMAPGGRKPVLGRYALNADHILLVVLKENADSGRAEAVIEETRAALRRAERGERWGIVVVQPTGAPSPAQAYYEP